MDLKQLESLTLCKITFFHNLYYLMLLILPLTNILQLYELLITLKFRHV